MTGMDDDEPEYPEFIWRILFYLTVLKWLEYRLSETFYRIGIFLLWWGMAIIFIWFGILKLFHPPPVTRLFTEAVWFLPDAFPFLLGLWEAIIGVCFLRRSWARWGILQLKFHMPGTFIAFFVIPGDAFVTFPIFPALPGLYVLKNIIFYGATFILWHELIESERKHNREKKQTDRLNA